MAVATLLQAWGYRDPEDAANPSARTAFETSMTRNGRTRKRSGVDPDIVLPAVMVQNTPVRSKVLLEAAPIHATRPSSG